MTRPARPSRRPSRRPNNGHRPGTWSRPKLLVLLAGALAIALLLLAGLALAVLHTLRPAGSPTGRVFSPEQAPTTRPDSHQPSGQVPARSGAELTAREDLAAQPMPVAPESASHPTAVSVSDPGLPIVLPPATSIGAAGVPSGYPHTPQGAMAQLAAIDQTALNTASMAGVRAVIAGWALPGGPTTSNWSGVHAMARLLTAAGLPGGGSAQLAIIATPLMGLIKGTVGTDFVIPCIDLELDITVTVTARGAVADCQRMIWHDRRWMIGPGPEPAVGPSVWPDSDLAVQVGYRDLHRA